MGGLGPGLIAAQVKIHVGGRAIGIRPRRIDGGLQGVRRARKKEKESQKGIEV
jgi:hypothetical protein